MSGPTDCHLGLRWEKATPTTESYNRQIVGFQTRPRSTRSRRRPEAAYARVPVRCFPASQFLPTGGVPVSPTGGNRSAVHHIR